MVARKKDGSTQAHQQLVADILEAFGAHPCILLRRRSVAVLKTERGTRLKVGQNGEADIDGVWKRSFVIEETVNEHGFQPLTRKRTITVGVDLAIECKTWKATPGDKQIKFAHAIQNMGSIYILARSVDDVRHYLRRHEFANMGLPV